MAGYVRDRIYKLKFVDPEYEGLEVRVRPMSIGALGMVGELEDLRKRGITAEDIGKIFELFDLFADHLVSWNLEVEKEDMPITAHAASVPMGPLATRREPVPATRESMRAQDIDFGLSLLYAWMDAVTGVSAPLAGASPSGVSYPAVPIPMETLSPSP